MVIRKNTNKVIGNRSFSNDIKTVKQLGKLTLKYLHKKKIAGIIKHIQGHEAATVDSNKKLPKESYLLKETQRKTW